MKLLVAFFLVAAASAPWIPAQEAPIFRSGTHLVEINVLVHNKGVPVPNLKKEDFVLSDKGKPQQISVFSVTASVDTQSTALQLPEDTFSNRASTDLSSVTIILLDRLNTLSSVGTEAYESSPKWLEDHALGYAKEHLIEFVQQLNPRDRVALYSLAESLTVLSDFSNDRNQLIEVLKNYRATSITDREKVDPQAIHTPAPCCFNGSIDRERMSLARLVNANRARSTMSALASIAAHVSAIPGRKNLVWLTADLPFSGAAVSRLLSRANIAIYPVDARGLVTRSFPGPHDDGDLVPGGGGRNLTAEVRPRGQDTMDQMAEDTGGRAFVNNNDLSDAVRTAVQDGAVMYTLGFYPDPETLDGKFHALKVHVKDSHLDVRYPKGYFALKDAPIPSQQVESRLAEAIQSPLESASVRLLARIERVNQPRPNLLSISASFDLHDIELAQIGDLRKGKAEITVVQQDAAGRLLNRDTRFLNFELTPEDYSAHLKSGVPFRELIDAKDGLAMLRILVMDAHSAATGSLIIPAAQIR